MEFRFLHHHFIMRSSRSSRVKEVKEEIVAMRLLFKQMKVGIVAMRRQFKEVKEEMVAMRRLYPETTNSDSDNDDPPFTEKMEEIVTMTTQFEEMMKEQASKRRCLIQEMEEMEEMDEMRRFLYEDMMEEMDNRRRRLYPETTNSDSDDDDPPFIMEITTSDNCFCSSVENMKKTEAAKRSSLYEKMKEETDTIRRSLHEEIQKEEADRSSLFKEMKEEMVAMRHLTPFLTHLRHLPRMAFHHEVRSIDTDALTSLIEEMMVGMTAMRRQSEKMKKEMFAMRCLSEKIKVEEADMRRQSEKMKEEIVTMRRLWLQCGGSFEWLPPNFSELRVVLLGNSWSERSSVGNFILGQTVFDTEGQPDLQTARGQWKDKEIVVINSPDLLLPDVFEDRLRQYVEDCVRVSDPGPHVFLLVLQPEDFTEDQMLRLCRVLQLFGDRSFDHSLVLISAPREESPGFMVQYRQHPPLKHMITSCRYRYLWRKDLEHPELLTRLGQIVKENKGGRGSVLTRTNN